MRQNTLKIAVTGLLVVALALLALPALIGRNVRAVAITNTLNLLPPEMQAQVELREITIDSGWFRSEARIDLEYTAIGSLPLRVQMQMDVQQGPLLFTPAGPTLGLLYASIDPRFDSEEIRRALAELPFSLPALKVTLLAGLTGNLHVGMAIAPVAHSDENGQLEFAGMDAQFIAFSDQSAQFNLTMGKLSAQEYSSTFQFSVDGLEIQTQTSQMNNLLAPGSAAIRMPEFRSDAPYPVSVTALEIDSRLLASTAGMDRTDIFQHIEVGRIESDMPLQSLRWTSELNEIRNDLFRRYYSLLVQLQDEINNSGGTITTEATRIFEELGLMFLQNRIVLNNSIGANAYDGDHTLDFRIVWRGLPDLTELARLDINAALAALDFTLDIALDLEAIMRSPLADMVDPYVQEGYIKLDSGRILLRASLTNSELIVNDELIPIDELF